MLPILNKDKTPKGWSYTIGAEKISNLLSESKTPVDLFYYHREYCSLSTNVEDSFKDLQGVKSYPSTYRYRKVLTAKWVSGKWGLSIFTVNSKERKKVLTILEKKAISNVIEWINKDRNETWFTGVHKYEIGINSEVASICFWEVHNSHVVSAIFKNYEPSE